MNSRDATSEMGEEGVIGPCVVCGATDGVKSIFKSRSILLVTHDDGHEDARILPPVDLCDSHRMPAARW